MTILAPFGGPWAPFWDHFTIKWVTDALRGTLEGPRVDFQWFLMDFGFPFGDHFGSLFDIFCYLKRQKACLDCRHDYCWLFTWTCADFWCPNLSIYMVNTHVFIRFHFFDFFMNLMISGPCLDFILDTLGGLGRPIWWFLGYWRLLEMSLIFRISPEPPQIERTEVLGGKLMHQGALQPNKSRTGWPQFWWNL